MSPEELKTATRPIYEWDGEDMIEIGRRPVDLEECRRFVDIAQKGKLASRVLDVGFSSHIISGGSNVFRSIRDSYAERQVRYAGVTSYLQNHPVGFNNPANEPLDLLSHDVIAQELQRDPIFMEYVCPITQEPVRHPIKDPVSGTVYEKSAIIEWLSDHQTSPITRQRLRVRDLVACPDVETIINNRLMHFQRLIARAATAEIERQYLEQVNQLQNQEN